MDDSNLTPYRAPDGSYVMRPRFDDLFDPPTNIQDPPTFHETPRNYDYLDGRTFNYSAMNSEVPQDSSANLTEQNVSETPYFRVYGFDPNKNDPFTNDQNSRRPTTRANRIYLVSESPTIYRVGRSQPVPIDFERLKPAQTRLEYNLRHDKFYQSNLEEGNSEFIQHPNRSSSLPQDANIAESSLPQDVNVVESSLIQPNTTGSSVVPPNIGNGSWVQFNGDVVFMYHTEPQSLPLVEFNQENNRAPAWYSNQETRNNFGQNEELSSERTPSQVRESHHERMYELRRENMHERAAFFQRFVPIRKRNVLSDWLLKWTKDTQVHGIDAELFQKYPGEITSSIRHYAVVLAELEFAQQHGGPKLVRTATRMRGVVHDFSSPTMHRQSSMEIIRDAFLMISTPNPQMPALATDNEEAPELDSFEQWCMEGNAEREITAMEQSFQSSRTRPAEIEEAEDRQPASTRRGGVSLRWWWRR